MDYPQQHQYTAVFIGRRVGVFNNVGDAQESVEATPPGVGHLQAFDSLQDALWAFRARVEHGLAFIMDEEGRICINIRLVDLQYMIMKRWEDYPEYEEDLIEEPVEDLHAFDHEYAAVFIGRRIGVFDNVVDAQASVDAIPPGLGHLQVFYNLRDALWAFRAVVAHGLAFITDEDGRTRIIIRPADLRYMIIERWKAYPESDEEDSIPDSTEDLQTGAVSEEGIELTEHLDAPDLLDEGSLLDGHMDSEGSLGLS